MRPASRRPSSPADPTRAAWVDGLRMLAGRELSEAQIRERLARRGHDDQAIETAVTRLRETGAIDDRRVAASRARTELAVRGRGRLRARRELAALGIDSETAESAVDEASAGLDERDLVERAVDRRLRGHATRPLDKTAVARLYRYLIGQGFPASLVLAVLRARSRAPVQPPDSD